MDIQLPISIEDIIVGETRRELDRSAVNRLADSIEQIGLRHPITVREKGDKYHLIAGRHRLEACRKLGREHVPAIIVKMTNDEARLWEIAENLHRSDLKKLDRDEQLAEWIRLTERIANSQNGRLGGRPPGIEAAARELGVHRHDAHRAVAVAGLTDEAKQAARDAGLDDNRSALLEAAKAEPEQQAAKIIQIKAAKLADAPLNDFEAVEKQVAALMSSWNKAGKEARERFLSEIDKPLMDQRYA